MAVLNVTPDSFSDGGRFLDPGAAEARALRLQDEGAHVLDVGAESSRPGAAPVSIREEKRRLLPVLKRLARTLKIPISVDTCKPEVAQAALDEGARIVNDIYGLRKTPSLARLAARYGASMVLMHMQGNPRTMQKKPSYKNVLREVRDGLKRSVSRALEAGLPKNRLMVDPGFGFGKSADHNFYLLGRLDQMASLRLPILAGLSRKSFLGNPFGLPPGERLAPSLAAAVIAISNGAHMLRVHDVREHRQAAAVADRSLAEAG